MSTFALSRAAAKGDVCWRSVMALLRVACAMARLLGTRAPANTQDASYPERPIHIVVPATPGGVTDILARAIGQHLTELWKERVIVDNRAGAGNQIAAEIVANAAPDGYTLLVSAEATLVINPYLYKSLRYDARRDFTPISGLVAINQALIVRNDLGVNSVAEFLAMAKQKPESISFGGYGIGSTGHLNMEMLQHEVKDKINGVKYKGAPPALSEIMGRHLDAMFMSSNSAMGPAKSGQVKILAIGSKERIPAYSDIQTVAETVPGFVARSWFCMVGPGGMPKGVVEKLNAAIVKIFQNPDFQEPFLKPNLFAPIVSSPAEFAAFIDTDSKKWKEGIKPPTIKLNN